MPGLKLLLIVLLVAGAQTASSSLGIFESQIDIGKVLHPGAARYDAAAKVYTVSGSGENMWFAKDEFHFVWKKVSADNLSLTADLSMPGTGGEGHRKGVLMIRQSLDPDSAYVDIARHGDGLTSLQFREAQGATTREVEADRSGPTHLRLLKQGDHFYMWLAGEGQDLQFAGGSTTVEIRDPFYVGIGVCSHNKEAVQEVSFTNVDLNHNPQPAPASYSTVQTVLASGDARVGYVSKDELSTPGWSADGHALSYQSTGKQADATFHPLPTAAAVGNPVPVVPGDFLYFEAGEAGQKQIWRKLADGTHAEQLTSDEFNNVLPMLSPDGTRLLFLSYSRGDVLPKNGQVQLRLMTLADKQIKTLTRFTGGPGSLGAHPWSPDGKRIVFISYQRIH